MALSTTTRLYGDHGRCGKVTPVILTRDVTLTSDRWICMMVMREKGVCPEGMTSQQLSDKISQKEKQVRDFFAQIIRVR